MYSRYIISDCYNCITENTRTATPYLQALHDNWLGETFGESHPFPLKHTNIQYAAHCLFSKWRCIPKHCNSRSGYSSRTFLARSGQVIELSRVTQELAQYTNFREKEKEILDRVMDPKRWLTMTARCSTIKLVIWSTNSITQPTNLSIKGKTTLLGHLERDGQRPRIS